MVCGRWSAVAVRGRGGVVGGCGEWLPADRRSRGFVRPVGQALLVRASVGVSRWRSVASAQSPATRRGRASDDCRCWGTASARHGAWRFLVGAYRLDAPGGRQWRCNSATRCAASPGRPVPAPRRNALPPDERTHSMDQPIIPGTPKATVSRKVADHPSSWIGDGSLVDACTVTGLPRSGDQPPQVRSSAMLRCQHDGPAIDDGHMPGATSRQGPCPMDMPVHCQGWRLAAQAGAGKDIARLAVMLTWRPLVQNEHVRAYRVRPLPGT